MNSANRILINILLGLIVAVVIGIMSGKAKANISDAGSAQVSAHSRLLS